ncbi:MAG: HlyD family efflux transporter periplasmic adaptor subunit [Pirellulales bacterium]
MSMLGPTETASSILRTDPAPPGDVPSRPNPFRSDGSETDVHSTSHRPGVARRLIGRLIGLVVAAAVVVGGGWAVAKYTRVFEPKQAATVLTHRVARGDLVITVTTKGNVESASNIDIRCLVAGGGLIKSIVADGTIVKEGDQLVELDSAAIDEQILQQRIGYEKARAIRDQAKNDLEAAKIALREYVEGTFKKEQQLVDAQITIAEENLHSAQNTLMYTERMFRKGYVTPLQLESQQFAVKRSQLELDTAKTAKRVLEEFTFAKMKNDLETLVATSEAKAKSEQTAFELEESKLKRLETQKANCLISAPQSGMVVFANESSSSRGSSSDRPKIEEGATVREGQVILRVPDLSQMQVKTTVHESKVESLRSGMPASVRIQNRKLTGYVTFIANQPESGGFFSSNGVKEYATFVRIDGNQSDLKPGMTADVEILVDDKKGVLSVPVQCVIEQGGKLYAWKQAGSGYVKTEVKLGPGDDRSVEVVAGLADGDVVLQNPPERSESSFSGASDARAQFGGGRRGAENGGAPGATGGPSGEGAGGAGSGGPGGGGPPGGRGGRSMDVMSLDKDGDGKVSRTEAPEPMQAFFGRMDTDGDGFITAAEAAEARARRASSGGGPGGGAPSFGPGGGGGPGGETSATGSGPGAPRGQAAPGN